MERDILDQLDNRTISNKRIIKQVVFLYFYYHSTILIS